MTTNMLYFFSNETKPCVKILDSSIEVHTGKGEKLIVPTDQPLACIEAAALLKNIFCQSSFKKIQLFIPPECHKKTTAYDLHSFIWLHLLEASHQAFQKGSDVQIFLCFPEKTRLENQKDFETAMKKHHSLIQNTISSIYLSHFKEQVKNQPDNEPLSIEKCVQMEKDSRFRVYTTCKDVSYAFILADDMAFDLSTRLSQKCSFSNVLFSQHQNPDKFDDLSFITKTIQIESDKNQKGHASLSTLIHTPPREKVSHGGLGRVLGSFFKRKKQLTY